MDSTQDLQIDLLKNQPLTQDDHQLIMEAYKAFLIVAHDKKYDSNLFLHHVEFIEKYPTIFDNLNLLAEFSHKIFQHLMQHKDTHLSSYKQDLGHESIIDTDKLSIELKCKSYRTNILHFLLTILKLNINKQPTILEKLSCHKITNILLLLICNDNIPFANRLSKLLRENRLPLTECATYLNEVTRFDKLLKDMWPSFRTSMTKHILTSKVAIEEYAKQFGGKSFFDCYVGICDFKWQYMNLLFKLSANITQEYCNETDQIIRNFFETDHAVIVQKFNLEANEAEAKLTALEERIKLIKQENESNQSAAELVQIVGYQYFLQHIEKINSLLVNLNINTTKQNISKKENEEAYKALITQILPNMEKMLSKKNNLSEENYKKTIGTFISLDKYPSAAQIITFMPAIIKINNYWIDYFRMQDFSLVTKLLLDKHEWLEKSFASTLNQAKTIQEANNLVNIKKFVNDLIDISKNVTPNCVASHDIEQKADILIALNKEMLADNNAESEIHLAFNERLNELSIQAAKASKEHMQKCKAEDSIYELSRFAIAYALQRINIKCFYVTHMLGKLGLASQKFYSELAQHRLFSEVFSLANQLSALILNKEVPSDKCEGLYQKLDIFNTLEQKYWKKHNNIMFQHILKYKNADINIKNILNQFKDDLWHMQVNGLLFKSRLARLKTINNDKNNIQYVNLAKQAKTDFENKQKAFSEFCGITKEDHEIDLDKIKEEFDLLASLTEKKTPEKPQAITKKSQSTPKPILTSEKKLEAKAQPQTNLSEPKPVTQKNTTTPLVVETKPVTKIVYGKPKPKKKPLNKTISPVIEPEIIIPKTPTYLCDLSEYVPTAKSKFEVKIEPKITIEDPIAKFKTNEIITLCTDVKTVLTSLSEEQAIAYVQGGYVRDKLRKKQPNDADIVTNFDPSRIIEKMEALGYKCKRCEKIESIQLFTCRKKEGKGISIDIKYSTLALEQEAQKSDLTINAFACFADGVVLDFVKGLKDLKKSNLKIVGDYNAKIKEDPKRTLRLIRFGIDFETVIPAKYVESIKQNAITTTDMPYPVYIEHIKKLFLKGNAKKCFGVLLESDLLSVIEESLSSTVFEKNKDLLVFLNWSLMHIDNYIKVHNHTKSFQPEHISALLLLPAFYESKDFSVDDIHYVMLNTKYISFSPEIAEKIEKINTAIKSTAESVVDNFMARHGKDIEAINKHMICTRIRQELIQYHEKYSGTQQLHIPLHDITNEYTNSLTYQFSNMKVNNTTNHPTHEALPKTNVYRNNNNI